ncbi:metallophosphoesterase family protein [Cellulomonas palmilytica]|uniref:metallophosphoesterase family protein n=1 Tax=Cellulomonas palmilytica TaxID=2608402 RepID=UPI001F43CEC1|nr:metallophosphoesterase family protein [Cellulomonas palmilytica]UJP39428.1 metallophosphoesterase family protein [Cellulomonas palmilytica]
MNEQTDATRDDRRARWLVRVALALVAVLVSLVYGLTTARAEAGFGPHLAQYAVTTDDLVVVDLGPLGTLEVDSPLPLTLGARVTVQEIPASLTEVDDATTLQALSGDLQRYVQFFSAPRATVDDVTRAIVADALRRAFGALVVIVGAWWFGRVALGGPRRAELGARWSAHRTQIAVGTALAVVVASLSTSSLGPGDQADDSRPVSHVFDGTALEGARVTGRLGGVIDTYGAKVLAAYRTNEEFYARADEALAVAWDERQEAQALEAARAAEAERLAQELLARESAAAVPPELVVPPDPTADPTSPTGPVPTTGATGVPDGGREGVDGTEEGGDAGTDAGADGGAGATPSGTPSPTPTTPEEDLVTLVVVSDLHCNVGMAPLITTLVERSGASVVLDAGDTTMNGTAVEQYCTSTFASAVPDGVDLVAVGGNHDSADSARSYAKAGATLLSGKVVEVKGIRVLGDADPNETRAGAATASLGESAQDAGDRLAATACDDDGVDLLLIHTPAVGERVLSTGCVPAQVSGHLHRRTDPQQVGLGVRFISSSTAGATLGQATVGPLNGTAELTVLRWDPATRLFVDHQVVRVSPSATVDVLERVPWPTIVRPERGGPVPINGPVPS